MSDTTTPSAAEVYGPVPEIIGWTWDKQAVNWRDASGEIRYDEDLAETPTPDDMLAWLRERGWGATMESDPTFEQSCFVSAWHHDTGNVTKHEAPTLHAALEQAVIAVGRAE